MPRGFVAFLDSIQLDSDPIRSPSHYSCPVEPMRDSGECLGAWRGERCRPSPELLAGEHDHRRRYD